MQTPSLSPISDSTAIFYRAGDGKVIKWRPKKLQKYDIFEQTLSPISMSQSNPGLASVRSKEKMGSMAAKKQAEKSFRDILSQKGLWQRGQARIPIYRL
jgi:hypothetical protein